MQFADIIHLQAGQRLAGLRRLTQGKLMSLKMVGQHAVQVSQDRGTLWVHAPDGSTVGRFSKRFGIDVHKTFAEQLDDGAKPCLHCTHAAAGPDEWLAFRRAMHDY